MEYAICNKSLVYYALRDKNTGRYICDTSNYTKEYPELSTTIYLKDIEMFETKHQIQDIANECNLQIRKIKIIDVGGV